MIYNYVREGVEFNVVCAKCVIIVGPCPLAELRAQVNVIRPLRYNMGSGGLITHSSLLGLPLDIRFLRRQGASHPDGLKVSHDSPVRVLDGLVEHFIGLLIGDVRVDEHHNIDENLPIQRFTHRLLLLYIPSALVRGILSTLLKFQSLEETHRTPGAPLWPRIC